MDDKLPDGEDNPLLQSEGLGNVDVLMHDVGGQLGDDVHEGCLSYPEGLEPLFFIPSTQDHPLSLIIAGGVGLELLLNCLEVVPEHPRGHGIQDGIIRILISHVKIIG